MSRRQGFRHPHPISIVTHISRFLFLLLIPLVRGLLLSLQGGFGQWLAGSWVDILMMTLISCIGVLEWLMSGYRWGEGRLEFYTGIFFRRSICIPLCRTSCVSIIHHYYLRPFGVVRLQADTPGGSWNRADFSILLKKEEANRLFDALERQEEDFLSREYRPRGLYVAVLSALLSNSFAGILFASTAISQAGKLLGKEFADRIYGTLEQITRLLAFGIPPAAAAIGYLLLGGWLLAFLVNGARHKNFAAVRKKESLVIHSGILTHRDYFLPFGQINYLDIRQSVTTRALRLYSVFLQTAGYGKNKDDLSALIPACNKKELHKTLKLLCPEFQVTERALKPNFGALLKFINDALWPSLLLPVVAWLVSLWLPDWSDFIWYTGWMATVPAIWFLLVRLFDFATSGLSRNGDMFTLRYSHFYYLHTIVLPKNRMAGFCLRQSILQRQDGRCDILVYSRSEGRKRHHLRNLLKKDAAALFGIPQAYREKPKKRRT